MAWLHEVKSLHRHCSQFFAQIEFEEVLIPSPSLSRQTWLHQILHSPADYRHLDFRFHRRTLDVEGKIQADNTFVVQIDPGSREGKTVVDHNSVEDSSTVADFDLADVGIDAGQNTVHCENFPQNHFVDFVVDCNAAHSESFGCHDLYHLGDYYILVVGDS